MKYNKNLFVAVLVVNLALSGCGGGGGTGGDFRQQYQGGVPDTGQPVQDQGGVPDIELPVITSSYDYGNARYSIPRKGSVTQSTNLEPYSESLVTKDLMHVKISGSRENPLYEIRYDNDADDESNELVLFRYEAAEAGDLENLELNLEDDYQTLYFDTSYGNEGNGMFLGVISDYDGDDDTDYLSVGLWWHIDGEHGRRTGNTGEALSLGAFVDGNMDEFTDIAGAGLKQATYNGDALGSVHYNVKNPNSIGEDTGSSLYLFNGITSDIELNADFENSIISGRLSNIEVHRIEYLRLEGDGHHAIVLKSAEIKEGFFTGSLSGNIGSVDVIGNWGGQFYGKDSPDIAAGTLAGGGTVDDPSVLPSSPEDRENGDPASINFVMVYTSERQNPQEDQ